MMTQVGFVYPNGAHRAACLENTVRWRDSQFATTVLSGLNKT